MSSSTTFSFIDSQTVLSVPVNEETTMCIQRANHGVARIYFIQKNGLEINIPDGIKVYDVTNTVYLSPFSKKPYFALGWTDNYSITLNGVPILDLVNERIWNVTTYPKTFDSLQVAKLLNQNENTTSEV